jgi:hypothetical protein
MDFHLITCWGVLHEDPDAFLRIGIPSATKRGVPHDAITQPDATPTQSALSADNSDVTGVVRNGQSSNSGKLAKIVRL